MEGKIYEELCNLYSSPNIDNVIKSRKIRFTDHVACMEGNKRIIIVAAIPRGTGALA
jgi:hypothetical protein